MKYDAKELYARTLVEFVTLKNLVAKFNSADLEVPFILRTEYHYCHGRLLGIGEGLGKAEADVEQDIMKAELA